MDFNEYQTEAIRTVQRDTFEERMLLGAMGLAGETGEVVEPIKKWHFHGKPLDTTHLALELGDVIWYVSLLAGTLGYTLEEIATANIEKLRVRYAVKPSGA